MTERAILLNLPKIRPINISFESLSFTVTVGRKKGELMSRDHPSLLEAWLWCEPHSPGCTEICFMTLPTSPRNPERALKGREQREQLPLNELKILAGQNVQCRMQSRITCHPSDNFYDWNNSKCNGRTKRSDRVDLEKELWSVEKKKQIIKGINGEFRSGELTAIMGPSGAGKSSLMNLLTGYQTKGMRGCVYANGVERKQSAADFKKETCYIMQDDQLHGIFTVMETMTMAADLKLGQSLSDKAKLMLIDDILQTLGLTSAKQTKCQKLSGGQRKRLSIALELIDNPPVMFLDEPTTGLDSSSSLQCITVLKALAKGGRTIVCTIHQPSASIYELFDHVYILAEGYCIYQGSSTNTVPFLLSVGLPCPQYHNPADFISEVANGEYGNFSQQLAIAAQDSRWRSITAKPEEMILDKKENKTAILIQQPSEFSRLYVLLYRNVIRLHRDWTVTHLKLILHFLVGILLGLNYQGCGDDGSKTFENVTFVFCSIIYISYTSMMPAILTFPSELSILKKENFNNWYSLRTYYSAFVLTSTPVQFILCSAYGSVAYYLSNQPLDITRFAMFLGMCILVSLTAEGVGLYLGTLDNSLNALFFGSIFTAYLLVYSGCLCLFSQMPSYLYIFSYLSYGRYAFEGLLLSVYGYGRAALPCPEEVIYCHLKFPDKIMAEMGVSDGRYWVDLLAIIGILLLFRTAAFIALRRKVCGGKM